MANLESRRAIYAYFRSSGRPASEAFRAIRERERVYPGVLWCRWFGAYGDQYLGVRNK